MPLPDDRYSRQRVLPEIGAEGQERLLASSVLLIGAGALGCAQAQLLARAGVGRMRIADRDLVEIHNLQRQLLFDERDAQERLPKAEAAARRLRSANSSLAVEAVVADVTSGNVEALLDGVGVVLDGTDNLETRYLINDACVKRGVPWIYGGAVGTSGMVMAVRPGAGPCLRCLFPEPAPPGSLPTCELSGVLNAAPAVVGALQVVEAIRLLVGAPPRRPGLLALDLWAGTFRSAAVRRDEACRCCGLRRFDFLEATRAPLAVALCGRHAVQVSPGVSTRLDLAALADRLAAAGAAPHVNGLLVHFQAEGCELLVFPDGRAIVKGTDDPAVARGLYARYVGS